MQPPLYFWLGARICARSRRPTAFALRLAVGAGDDRDGRADRLCRRAAGGNARRHLRRRHALDVLDAGRHRAACDHGRAARPRGRDDDLLVVSRPRDRARTGTRLRLDRGRLRAFLPKGSVAPVDGVARRSCRSMLWNRRCEATRAPSAARVAGRRCLAFFAIVAPWPIALVAHYRLFPLEKLHRRVHDRPLHRRHRESIRAVLVLRAGRHPRVLPVDRVPADGDRYGVAAAARAATRTPQIARLVRLALRVDRRAAAILQLRAHEAAELHRARIARARAGDRALFRGGRAQGRHAIGGHFRRDRAGRRSARSRLPSALFTRNKRLTAEIAARSCRRCSRWASRSSPARC